MPLISSIQIRRLPVDALAWICDALICFNPGYYLTEKVFKYLSRFLGSFINVNFSF